MRTLLIWFDKLYSWWVDRPLPANSRLHHRYVIRRFLGMGSYGMSYLCDDELTGEQVVLKQVKPSKRRGNKGRPIYEYETTLLRQIDHPAVPKLLERFTHKGHLFFAMEYMNGLNFEDVIFAEGGRFDERESLLIIEELLGIVAYLHQAGIVHRDVRIPNVIRVQGELKLIDFGLARRLGDRATSIAEDLRNYVIEKQIKRAVEFTSDFYSMGHFLLFLLYSTYEAPEEQEEKSWEEELTLRPLTRHLLRRMLQIEPPYANVAELREDLLAAIAACEQQT